MAAACLLVEPKDCPDPVEDIPVDAAHPEQTAVLAGGCFWCTEAVFQQLKGVQSVTSGYAGGAAETADYRSVCTGRTGHAEVIRIQFDARVITYGRLLKVFFSVAHDPTQLNRQGYDEGTQYRSAIFYENEQQRRMAEAYLRQLIEANVFRDPIVTRLEPLTAFYPAEDYHQNYAALNPTQPYIASTALPKVATVRSQFDSQVK